jgi:competence protein ComEA
MAFFKTIFLSVILAFGSLAVVSAHAAGSEPAISARPDVNINTANAAELSEALTGVGISRANAIVVHRQKSGPFKSAEELTNVKGIGAATVKRNKDHIKLK